MKDFVAEASCTYYLLHPLGLYILYALCVQCVSTSLIVCVCIVLLGKLHAVSHIHFLTNLPPLHISQGINNLQSTCSGFGFVSAENVFKVSSFAVYWSQDSHVT